MFPRGRHDAGADDRRNRGEDAAHVTGLIRMNYGCRAGHGLIAIE
jgi:hypothetical protein